MQTNKLPKKTVQDLVIEKVSQLTKGFVKLNSDHANQIINIVLSNNNQPYVVHYRHNAQIKGSWEMLRNIATTQEIIDEKIKEALLKAPVMDCYKFECFNEEGLSEGTIYTINPFLFDKK